MEHINYLDEVEKLLTERGFIWAVAEDDELPPVQRKYKDTVFCMLFRKKSALLSLYNAVNGKGIHLIHRPNPGKPKDHDTGRCN